MLGVFIGRFNPVHLGHLAVIKAMQENCGKYLIVIGSCNSPMSKRNFFSYVERRSFIRDSLECLFEPIIVGMPDYDNDQQWLVALDDLLGAYFNIPSCNVKAEVVFFGGSEEDVDFFIRDNRNVRIVNRFDGINSPKISASEIRDDLRYERSVEGKLHPRIIEEVTQTFMANWALLKDE